MSTPRALPSSPVIASPRTGGIEISPVPTTGTKDGAAAPLLFLTLFGGLQTFGPTGLLLGPLVGSLTVVALTLVARRRS